MVAIPNEILDGFLLSNRTREDIVILADALEEYGSNSAAVTREALDVVVEPRGRGWFVGFTMKAKSDSQWLNEITYQLANRACVLGSRLAA